MTIEEYIKRTIADLTPSLGSENSEGYWISIEFDIGVTPKSNGVIVMEDSTNRIKFTLEIKRK